MLAKMETMFVPFVFWLFSKVFAFGIHRSIGPIAPGLLHPFSHPKPAFPQSSDPFRASHQSPTGLSDSPEGPVGLGLAFHSISQNVLGKYNGLLHLTLNFLTLSTSVNTVQYHSPQTLWVIIPNYLKFCHFQDEYYDKKKVVTKGIVTAGSHSVIFC